MEKLTSQTHGIPTLTNKNQTFVRIVKVPFYPHNLIDSVDILFRFISFNFIQRHL